MDAGALASGGSPHRRESHCSVQGIAAPHRPTHLQYKVHGHTRPRVERNGPASENVGGRTHGGQAGTVLADRPPLACAGVENDARRGLRHGPGSHKHTRKALMRVLMMGRGAYGGEKADAGAWG